MRPRNFSPSITIATRPCSKIGSRSSIGAVHRIENPGSEPVQIIEVQSGGYLGEDDIVRLDDTYGRKGRTD